MPLASTPPSIVSLIFSSAVLAAFCGRPWTNPHLPPATHMQAVWGFDQSHWNNWVRIPFFWFLLVRISFFCMLLVKNHFCCSLVRIPFLCFWFVRIPFFCFWQVNIPFSAWLVTIPFLYLCEYLSVYKHVHTCVYTYVCTSVFSYVHIWI